MAFSPANFLFVFLLICVTLLLAFIFFSALLAWILSRIFGASVGFCVGGCNSLRDVVVVFKKGGIESVSIGEVKLNLCYSLVKHGIGSSSRGPKLQVLICNLEVIMRPSNKSTGKKKVKKPNARAFGKGKWRIICIARYLSVSVKDLVLKTPKSTFEIKELGLDICQDGGSESDLFVRLQILPLVIHIGDPQASCDQLCNSSGGGFSVSSQASIAAVEKSYPFICEKISISCEFGHVRYYFSLYSFFLSLMHLFHLLLKKRKWIYMQDIQALYGVNLMLWLKAVGVWEGDTSIVKRDSGIHMVHLSIVN